MSRGLGKWEKAIMGSIRNRRKPMMFAEMRAEALEPGDKLPASMERALRRALHGLVKKELLIAIGSGGPSEPFRYFLHPILIGMLPDEAELRALHEAIKGDAGVAEACGRSMARLAADADAE